MTLGLLETEYAINDSSSSKGGEMICEMVREMVCELCRGCKCHFIVRRVPKSYTWNCDEVVDNLIVAIPGPLSSSFEGDEAIDHLEIGFVRTPQLPLFLPCVQCVDRWGSLCSTKNIH